jgi:choline dehydrogenase-like flavoprotein
MRQMLSTLKILATFAYYEAPEVRAARVPTSMAPRSTRTSALLRTSEPSELVHLDGRTLERPRSFDCDVVVVGSGPAGATVARALALEGLDVIVLEEGFEAPPSASWPRACNRWPRLYREMGTSMALGTSPMPFLQGVAVGGTSVVNGAISWRFSEETLDRLGSRGIQASGPSSSSARLRAHEDALVERLGISDADATTSRARRTSSSSAGATKLSIASRPIARNVRGCRGSGRCLQGCPHGAKLSVDRNAAP